MTIEHSNDELDQLLWTHYHAAVDGVTVPEQNEYSGCVTFTGFHGLQTLSIEKL